MEWPYIKGDDVLTSYQHELQPSNMLERTLPGTILQVGLLKINLLGVHMTSSCGSLERLFPPPSLAR